MTKRWCEIQAQLGHQGTRKGYDITVYTWVRDVVEAWKKIGFMGGIKKKRMSNVRFLNPEEGAYLERRIAEDGLSLTKAKRKWYTTTEEYRWW